MCFISVFVLITCFSDVGVDQFVVGNFCFLFLIYCSIIVVLCIFLWGAVSP